MQITRLRHSSGKPYLAISVDGELLGWIIKRGKRWVSQPKSRTLAWGLDAGSLRSAVDWLV